MSDILYQNLGRKIGECYLDASILIRLSEENKTALDTTNDSNITEGISHNSGLNDNSDCTFRNRRYLINGNQ